MSRKTTLGTKSKKVEPLSDCSDASDNESLHDVAIDGKFSDDENEILEHDVNYKVQAVSSSELRSLISFFSDSKMINPKQSNTTNIIDKQYHTCYNVPQNKIDIMFNIVNSCRKRTNIPLMLAETQQTMSGIVLDFDIYQDVKISQLKQEIYNTLAQKVLEILLSILNFPNKKEKVYIGITKKPAVLYSEDKKCHKDGFHMLIPSIKVQKGVKRLLINKLISDNILEDVFEEVIPAKITIERKGKQKTQRVDINTVSSKINQYKSKEHEEPEDDDDEKDDEKDDENKASNRDKSIQSDDNLYKRADFIDKQSPNFPVFFIGSSTKKGQPPYKLIHIYEAIMNTQTKNIVINLNNKMLKDEKCNLCAEFSLNFSIEHGIVEKKEYLPIDKYLSEISEQDKIISEELDGELKNFGELSTNSIHDSQISELKEIIDALDIARSDDYSDWFNVLCALANTSPSYKSLAEYFSRKSPKFRQDLFDREWEKIVSGRSANKSRLSVKSLYYWAKLDNPNKYKAIIDKSIRNIMFNMVFEVYKCGTLSHYDISKILYTLTKNKFVSDVPEGEKARVWYEFMLEDDEHLNGELFKWHRWDEIPPTLSNYISEVMPNIFNIIYTDIKKKYEESSDEKLSLYYKKMLGNFGRTMQKLGDNSFKKSIMSEAIIKFRKYGFSKQLDKDPLARGVQNGILKLSIEPEGKPLLITGYHNYCISQFTTVPYVPFDPNDSITKKVMIAFRNLFPDDETDTHEFVMSVLASTLDSNEKEPAFYIIKGGGANGKSTLIDLHLRILGQHYGAKMKMDFLLTRSSNSEAATPNIMALKTASLGIFSESNADGEPDMTKIKELTGNEPITGRKLNQNLETFNPNAVLMAITNHEFVIRDTDYGTWRRIVYIPLKISFFAKENPNYDTRNPHHRLGNHEIVTKWRNDPEILGRYYGMMVWYHYWLYHKYGGSVMNIPHKHIELETKLYENRQNTIALFLSRRCVKLADHNETRLLSVEINKYIKWYKDNYSTSCSSRKVIDQFLNSSIGQAISESRQDYVLKGYRFLDPNEEPAPGETYETKKLLEFSAPKNNWGIPVESSEVYHKRICKEWAQWKHIFNNSSTTDVCMDNVFEERKERFPVQAPIVKDKAIIINNKVLPSGIAIKVIDEVHVDNNENDFTEDIERFITHKDDICISDVDDY